ncbi:MAG: hypothetical protein JW736_02280 [Deltaproteobacteria bacterium]|nr:hypothetical protein [Deltaproteobacteria bacterium]MBN2687820.1 hypothetical protein [Deltaproteobacteria bacterium]
MAVRTTVRSEYDFSQQQGGNMLFNDDPPSGWEKGILNEYNYIYNYK